MGLRLFVEIVEKDEVSMKTVKAIIVISFIFAYGMLGSVGCSGGAKEGSVVLSSITVTPANSTITFNASQQFTATGTYSDNTKRDITLSVTWSTTSSGIVNISNAGIATPIASGTTTIIATSGGISGSSIINVSHFVDGGKLKIARHYHSSILLKDGTVLITGGYDNNDNQLRSAEIYDLTSHTSTLIGNMISSRASHQSILLQNGNVLLIGGWNASTFLEMFDTASNTFSASSLPTTYSKTGFVATSLQDGRVLISGGETYDGVYYTCRNDAIIYDPATQQLSGGWMIKARKKHTATLLPSGKVLIAGGYDGWSYLTSAELYDPVTNTSQEIAFLNYGREGHSATLTQNGDVLLIGGHSYFASSGEFYVGFPEKYENNLNKFTSLGVSAGSGRYNHSAMYLPYYNKIYLVGGQSGSWSSWDPNIYALDVNDYSIQQIEQSSVLSVGASVLQLSDRQFMISGGKDTAALDSIKLFVQ